MYVSANMLEVFQPTLLVMSVSVCASAGHVIFRICLYLLLVMLIFASETSGKNNSMQLS